VLNANHRCGWSSKHRKQLLAPIIDDCTDFFFTTL